MLGVEKRGCWARSRTVYGVCGSGSEILGFERRGGSRGIGGWAAEEATLLEGGHSLQSRSGGAHRAPMLLGS